MAGPSAVFTEMVSTTLRNMDTTPVDNVTKHNALLTLMKKKGNIKKTSGGYELQKPLIYNETGNYTRFSGYGEIPTSQQPVITSAKYEWREIALSVQCSYKELNQNNSKEAMIKLKDVRIKAAMATAANNFSVDLYSDGTEANQIGGLAHIIQDNGQGTVGDIDSSTETWWQNDYQELAGTDAGTYSALRAGMNSLWLRLNRGLDKPELIVMSHDFYSTFEGGLQDLQRYGDATTGDLGFESLKYKTANVVFDDNANFGTTAEKAYMLNLDYLELEQHTNASWKQDGERTPVNQMAVVIPIYWMGNLCCTNRDLQGVVIDAA